MLNDLLDPFIRFEFMRNSLAAVILVGLVCAPIGVYVVLRRMAFIGDALAHTILPGIVFASIRGLNLFVGAVLAAVATALGIGWLSRRESVREDTAIGIVFTGMFALGILLMSTTRTFRDFTHILFGNILGTTRDDLILTAIIAVIVIGSLVLFHKEFELTSFDPTHAEVIGLKADRQRYWLLILLALTVVTAIQAVGVVLTSAMLVTPAAAASLVTNRLPRMMMVATVIAIGSGVVGLYFSYRFSVASGASIVLTCTAAFGAAWLIRISVRWINRRRAA
ncbi:MAG: metal ABC transporter permease [Anaerolinea sp.]|nr:metal ABC transporter permease [Anaerolinea sp.]MCC6976127.1 metal ABC transporter permease [Anaerolineae bacterium]